MKLLETTFKINVFETIGEPAGIFMEFPYQPAKTAEYFRQYVILPALNVYERIEVDLGDIAYSASWLIEAFAGLINYGILTLEEFKRKVFITCQGHHFYSVQINQYVAQAIYNSKIYIERNKINFDLGTTSKCNLFTDTLKESKETVVLVYENFEIPNPNLNILCLELCGSVTALRQLVDENDVLVYPLRASLRSIYSLENKDFRELMCRSGMTFNMFSCDRDNVEQELNEICTHTDHRVRVLRRLLRTPELTIFDEK
jgi:hypothetical protein